MNIDERFRYYISNLTFKAINNTAPPYITDKLTLTASLHNYQTRQLYTNELSIPKYKHELTKRTFTYQAAATWNSLSADIRTSSTVKSFKSRYKNKYSTISDLL